MITVTVGMPGVPAEFGRWKFSETDDWRPAVYVIMLRALSAGGSVEISTET